VVTILNNTIADNMATITGGGISVTLYSDTAAADITNNIIWNNAPLLQPPVGRENRQ